MDFLILIKFKKKLFKFCWTRGGAVRDVHLGREPYGRRHDLVPRGGTSTNLTMSASSRHVLYVHNIQSLPTRFPECSLGPNHFTLVSFTFAIQIPNTSVICITRKYMKTYTFFSGVAAPSSNTPLRHLQKNTVFRTKKERLLTLKLCETSIVKHDTECHINTG